MVGYASCCGLEVFKAADVEEWNLAIEIANARGIICIYEVDHLSIATRWSQGKLLQDLVQSEVVRAQKEKVNQPIIQAAPMGISQAMVPTGTVEVQEAKEPEGLYPTSTETQRDVGGES